MCTEILEQEMVSNPSEWRYSSKKKGLTWITQSYIFKSHLQHKLDFLNTNYKGNNK